MSEHFLFALKRAALIYAAIAAPLCVAGVVWAIVDHHRVGFTVPVLYFIAAALLAGGAAFGKSSSREEHRLMPIKQRREAFSTQMWLFAVALALGCTALLLQQLL